MEVRLFLFADFANVDAGRKLNIIGAFNQFNVEQVPYEHPLSISSFALRLHLESSIRSVRSRSNCLMRMGMFNRNRRTYVLTFTLTLVSFDGI